MDNVKLDYDKHSCIYNNNDISKNRTCPFYSINDIVKKYITPDNISSMEEGAVILITLKWNCYVDKQECEPSDHIKRVDMGTTNHRDYSYSETVHPFQSTDTRIIRRTTGILFMVEVKVAGHVWTYKGILLVGSTTLALIAASKDITFFYLFLYQFCRARCCKASDSNKMNQNLIMYYYRFLYQLCIARFCNSSDSKEEDQDRNSSDSDEVDQDRNSSDSDKVDQELTSSV